MPASAAKSAKLFKGKATSRSTAFTKSGKGSDYVGEEGHEGTADAKAGKVGSASGDSKADKVGTTADDAKAKKVGKSSGGDGAELTPHSVLGISASFESIDDMVGTVDAKATKVGKSSGGGGGKTDKEVTSKTPKKMGKVNTDTILWRPGKGNLSY